MLNHVLLHQTIIGEEALLQLAKVGETPDLIVGCTGGGSNFAGLFFPFLREKLAGRISPVIRAVEPSACPSLTRGVYALRLRGHRRHDAADQDAHLGPRLHPRPDPRRWAALPRDESRSSATSTSRGMIEAVAKPQRECFAAGVQFARTEGSFPHRSRPTRSPPPSRKRCACRESGEERVILTALCGHGHLDLPAYEAYLSGTMIDRDLDAAALATAVEALPPVPVLASVARGKVLPMPRPRAGSPVASSWVTLPSMILDLSSPQSDKSKIRVAAAGRGRIQPPSAAAASGSLSARRCRAPGGLVCLVDRRGGKAKRVQGAQKAAIGLV